MHVLLCLRVGLNTYVSLIGFRRRAYSWLMHGIHERPQKGELMSFGVPDVLLSCGVQEKGTLMLCGVRRRE